MWQQLKLAGHVLRLNARQATYNKSAACATIAAWAIRIGLTILLYHQIYQTLGVGQIKGTSFITATSSMLLSAFFNVFSARELFFRIQEDHETGAMGTWINKPISYILWRIATLLGVNSLAIMGMFVVVLVCFSTVFKLDLPDITLRVLAGVPLLVMGIILGALINGMIGFLAIWLQDARSIWNIQDKINMVFGGAYVPLTFFPATFRLVGESLPMSATQLVVQIFYHDFWGNYPRFILTQVFWLVVFVVAMRFMLARVNKHLSTNGG
jgi:ABC-2 type transport system permease protein